MRLEELDLDTLLSVGPARDTGPPSLDEDRDGPVGSGILRFAGERVLLLDAVALGLLRKQLVELLGLTAAHGVLTRFGYSHGWRTAETLETRIDWASPDDWRRAGGRLHRVKGLVDFEPDPDPPSGAFAAGIWRNSYEAEQHVLHLGTHDAPVCWTLCGFASGYLSRAFDARIVAREIACEGHGDTTCRMVARRVDDWDLADDPAAAEDIGYYERDCLDADLRALQRALLRTDARLQAARQRLDSPAVGADAIASASGEGIVARSRAMRRVLDVVDRVAQTDATVLVTGESGVGKERVARRLHSRSARADGPFVAVNCGALAETLLESELFGHRRGAFTGADTDRVGLFEAAEGGTLFLDEIAETSPSVQVKLLRVLQEREVRRLGENESRPVDVRVVAATWHDMRSRVAEGAFREDLFYRLAVVSIDVPPLRERRDDILGLVPVLLGDAAQRLGRPNVTLSRDALDVLLAHDWPGNVRELQNALEHGVALARGDQIDTRDLPATIRRSLRSVHAGRPARADRSAQAGSSDRAGPDAPTIAALAGSRSIADVERRHIEETLAAFDGNRAETARALGISEATLYRRLRSYAEA